MKKLYTALLMVMILAAFSLTAFSAGGSLRVLVDGKPIDSSEAYITDSGTTMIPLRAVMEAFGCDVAWDPDTQTISITSDTENASQPIESPTVHNNLVVLDPGHGGSASGAEYNGVKEKDLNLAIALQAAKLLEANGLTVLMTRTDDQDVGLYERTDMANGQEAGLFVSVHCNANLDHDDAMGIYTCAYNKECTGWQLAEILYHSMQEAAGAPAIGMEPRPELAVLRTSKMPAALVECGFMSTPEELALLVQPEYQAKLARGIADGVLAYLAQN